MEGMQISRKDKENLMRKEHALKIFKYIGKTIVACLYAILIFIIITSCIIMYDATTHPGKTPSVFGYKAMTVLTGSMRPEIKPGDLIIVRYIKDLNAVKVGTIVTYRNKENTLITHRVSEIIKKDNINTYITKGDANPVSDVEPFSENQLEGIYFIKVPYVGYISMFIKTGPGLILFIFIPMVLMLGMEIRTHLNRPKTKSA